MVVVPEFLREGTAVADYYDPPLLIAGSWNGEPNGIQGEIASLLAADPERINWVQCRQAEMMKSLCNVFHAMKVTFANEVGALCQEIGVDGRKVMNLLVQDHKLNISPVYLRPGMPYGGSCLPKDLEATIALAADFCVDLPLLRSIRDSNMAAKKRAIETVSHLNGFRNVAMDGVAFKSGTDDLRRKPHDRDRRAPAGQGLRPEDPRSGGFRGSATRRQQSVHREAYSASGRAIGSNHQ